MADYEDFNYESKPETTISIYPDWDEAIIFTSDVKMIEMLEELCSVPGSRWEFLEDLRNRKGELAGKYYGGPKELITFRAKE